MLEDREVCVCEVREVLNHSTSTVSKHLTILRDARLILDRYLMAREKVLFVCIHNSARSQMADAYLNRLGAKRFEAESAGIEPGTLNPLAVETMKEDGIDISGNRTKSVFEFLKQGRRYAYVITVCDEASAERCPVFPGPGRRLHWGFPDPSALQGSHEERRAKTRAIRDQIRRRVEEFVKGALSDTPISDF